MRATVFFYYQSVSKPASFILRPAPSSSVITLTLLHPIQATPMQNWSFQTETTISIGRSTDNDVVLYSAVVSRHHVELRLEGEQWHIVNLGTNGTYVEDRRVEQCAAKDGLIFRLATSGPKILVRIQGQQLSGDEAEHQAQRAKKAENPDPSRETFAQF
ncbi:FHA domain-containing protein [Synechococcus moorigangaii CMS01]|nr:FHA domain-containing protein [Synechococcus moorigangaii CMS01]